jgi:hypothetical protein
VESCHEGSGGAALCFAEEAAVYADEFFNEGPDVVRGRKKGRLGGGDAATRDFETSGGVEACVERGVRPVVMAP